MLIRDLGPADKVDPHVERLGQGRGTGEAHRRGDMIEYAMEAPSAAAALALPVTPPTRAALAKQKCVDSQAVI
jgi:hypothetical protein